jgi:mono/diheme cytochrome c family protein
MRPNLATAILLAASLAMCLVAVSLAAPAAPAQITDTDDRGVWRSIAAAPVEARSWKNPYAGWQDAVLAGEKLFRQHCAECHGDDARGLRNAPSLRSPGVQNATDGELVWFLRNGKLLKGMPSWSGLPVERRWQLVAYLRTLR